MRVPHPADTKPDQVADQIRAAQPKRRSGFGLAPKRLRGHGRCGSQFRSPGRSTRDSLRLKSGSCRALTLGDHVEAVYDGAPRDRGPVVEIHSTLELFWILDPDSGTRKLLDVEAMTTRRVRQALALETDAPEICRMPDQRGRKRAHSSARPSYSRHPFPCPP